jgi:hypothetical protein
MKYAIVFGLSMFVLACSTTNNHKYRMAYLDSIKESSIYVDSLKQVGIDTILLYHKKHGFYREYFVFWLHNSKLNLRKINELGITEIAEWNRNGYYKDKRIFEFYIKNSNIIETDKLREDNIKIIGTDTFYYEISHYPYIDIEITIGETTKSYHMPYGIRSKFDNQAFHFARLIESTIYNLEQTSHWKQAEKRFKYYPKNFNPYKKRWQKWEQKRIDNGEIWVDYYH